MNETLKSPLEMFYHWEQTTPDAVRLRQPTNLQWEEITWRDFGNRVRRVAQYLKNCKLPPKSSVAICSANSCDWFVADMAIMLSGHISIPLYAAQDFDSAKYIIEHSEVKVIFLGAFSLAGRADELLPADITRIALRDCEASCDDSLTSIIDTTEPLLESPVPDLEEVFTIMYTSGTSGTPKGVMHRYYSPAKASPEVSQYKGMPYDPDNRERYFSFLPLSHIAERAGIELESYYNNSIVSFSEGLETFAAEVKSVQPTLFFAVPRLWILFKQSVDAKFTQEQQAQWGDTEKSMIRKELGLSAVKFAVTAAAPCPTDVQNWYLDLGLKLREGYGMTENFVHGCMWYTDDTPIPGCVGIPWPSVEVKLTDEQEICFKADTLMKGYYKADDKTAEVIVDGWYHTGDTGTIDEHGRVRLTGRISEIFKTTKGKFVKPSELEDRFGRLNCLAQFCVIGHGKDQPILLTTLAPGAEQRGAEALEQEITAALNEINSELPSHEQIRQVFIPSEEWTVDNGLLTPTLKIKRKNIEAKFSDWVDAQLNTKTVVWQ